LVPQFEIFAGILKEQVLWRSFFRIYIDIVPRMLELQGKSCLLKKCIVLLKWLSQKRVGELYSQPALLCENRISGSDAVELAAHVVNQEKIAIRQVCIAQAQIHADWMIVDGIHLNER